MNLPPPPESSSNPTSSFSVAQKRMLLQRCESKFKIRKLNDTVEEDNVTQMEPNFTLENTLVSEPEADLRPHTTEPTTEEESQRSSAKSQLYNLCSVRHWKAPLYECTAEGPCHMKIFTGKVTVEMKEDSRITVLECFGNPQYKKKIAAEQAAEAALWYLKNVGYTLQTEKASGRKGRSKPISKMMVTGEPV
ncbi:unnamed protein product [Arabidopsis thaliana]|uniref:DRBM domain-containing protein n=1 Tax=Arabidopsis thaliana TaxID=3702 RepID=A0A5S9XPB2_ARATH|nr:unnamed protein product [Arabidopsis thaliana]